MADLDPIVIILATSGSKGNRILFRYPHETTKKNAVTSRCKWFVFRFFFSILENSRYSINVFSFLFTFSTFLPIRTLPCRVI